eukprot:g26466.t1
MQSNWSVQDLLLNAVALKFVLEVAELLFEAFAPRRSRSFIGNLRPLNLELAGASHTDCLMPVIYLAALVGFMAVAVYDGLGRLHWSITNPFTELDESDSDTYVHRATESLIRNLDVNPYSPMTIYDPSFDHLRNVGWEKLVWEFPSKGVRRITYES